MPSRIPSSTDSTSSSEAPFWHVEITSPFWLQKRDMARFKTIPSIVKAQKTENHWRCLTWKEGHTTKPHPFWDSDIYKVVEATCYFLMEKHDDTLLAVVEDAVGMIRNAQYEDGYINSYYTVRGVAERWTNLRDMHELYCIGHLLEATVAYETLTGNGRLLGPALKAVQHVASIFGNKAGQRKGYPGHEEIEIGLLRLYELSKEPLALELAQFFILERGRRDENNETYYDHEAKARGADPYADMESEHKAWYHGVRDYGYQQADDLLINTVEIKGHSVRAMYFLTAATDLVRLTGNEEVRAAINRLWKDLVEKKIYVTGGIGSDARSEGFGTPYALGDTAIDGTCYAETCATFALIVWCQRMLRLELRSEFADIMETCLYNGFLGAIGLEGNSFYYQNVLRTLKGDPKERSKWFGVACCPPNVAKLLASMGSLIYSFRHDVVIVHMYIGSSFKVPGTDLVVTQKTNMPWSGDVEIEVSGSVGLALRIPDWTQGSYSCSVSGGEVKDGYLFLPPVGASTTIKLSFSMAPRRIYANAKTGKNEVCVARGPLVYCIEDVDNPGVDIDNVAVMDDFIAEGGTEAISADCSVIAIELKGRQLSNNRPKTLYSSEPWRYESEVRTVVAVPFFARANRGGEGAMRVWIPRIGKGA